MSDRFLGLVVVGLLGTLVLFTWRAREDRPAPAAPIPAPTPAAPAMPDLSGLDLTSLVEELVDVLHQQGVLRPKIDPSDPGLQDRKVFAIGDLDAHGTERILRELSLLDRGRPALPIDLYLDTQGGTGGYVIANFLQTLSSPVNVWALDWCASAGAIVLASGTGRRRCFDSSRIILHLVTVDHYDEDDPSTPPERQHLASRRAFWAAHANLPESILAVPDERYYNLTPDEALRYGIVDEILPGRR